MTLGEAAQAAAAFVAVQTALNWVVGNYQHLAEWTASVNRVSSLLIIWDEIDSAKLLSQEVEAESVGWRE
jgi:ABC-type uncharacterized transport system fused permease/ATPase subunit